MGAWPRWTMRSTGISGTSHAPKEGSADTRHVTPAASSISRARSTAFVLSPTGNCRPRMPWRGRAVSSMGPRRHAPDEKNLRPRPRLLLGGALNLEPPGRRQLHAALAEGLFGVVHVVLRRADREDLRARVHAGRRPRRRAEGRPHPLRDPVRARPRRDLVLPQDVVRVHAELQVVPVPRLLRD